MKNNWLVKAFLSLPLWGKVVVPAVAVFLAISVFKAAKFAIGIGLLALIAYGVLRLYKAIQGNKED
ncbi:hypothetical protein [Pontibacter sp. G13]|uniref:hypothetical protein n=1 Tax=Pontibacter sp. G13 TaxID=3074898 RepID=UPI002889754D|nr:hypothetical protein [Pontibacter sp. G13]WNJ17722.1 hypothetical protein RJD25_22960 [Pontibacter sp. G13]